MNMRNNVNELLNESAEWRLIGLLFECPAGDWKREVRGLAGEVSDERLKKAAEFAETQAGEGLYHAIFGPGGPAPAREISYRDWVQPGYLLSELSAYYEAFSYSPTTAEVPDHIAVESGFVAFLKMKEAFALMREDGENADVTATASRKFIEEHLSKVSERMAKSLAESEIDYLVLASDALFRRVGPDNDAKMKKILPVLSNPDEEVSCSM